MFSYFYFPLAIWQKIIYLYSKQKKLYQWKELAMECEGNNNEFWGKYSCTSRDPAIVILLRLFDPFLNVGVREIPDLRDWDNKRIKSIFYALSISLWVFVLAL